MLDFEPVVRTHLLIMCLSSVFDSHINNNVVVFGLHSGHESEVISQLARLHNEDLFSRDERLHSCVQSFVEVLEADLSAGRSRQLPLPDELAQFIQHGSEGPSI